MEGREVPDIWISKGRTYPPSRVNTQASVEIWISSVHVFRSGLLSRCLSLFPPLLSGRVEELIEYRYRCLQAFFLTAYFSPPLPSFSPIRIIDHRSRPLPVQDRLDCLNLAVD